MPEYPPQYWVWRKIHDNVALWVRSAYLDAHGLGVVQGLNQIDRIYDRKSDDILTALAANIEAPPHPAVFPWWWEELIARW